MAERLEMKEQGCLSKRAKQAMRHPATQEQGLLWQMTWRTTRQTTRQSIWDLSDRRPARWTARQRAKLSAMKKGGTSLADSYRSLSRGGVDIRRSRRLSGGRPDISWRRNPKNGGTSTNGVEPPRAPSDTGADLKASRSGTHSGK